MCVCVCVFVCLCLIFVGVVQGIPESAFRDQPSAQEGPVDQPGGEPGEEMEGEEPQVSQDPPPLRQPQEVAAQEQVQGRGEITIAEGTTILRSYLKAFECVPSLVPSHSMVLVSQ